MNLSSSFLTRFLRDTSGATLVEFLIALPVLMTLSVAILEFTSLQIARIRTDKSAYMIAGIITQLTRAEHSGLPGYFTVDSAQMDAILSELDNMLPTSTRVGAKVVVSGFTQMDRIYLPAALVPVPVNAPMLLWAKGRVLEENPEDSASTISALGSNVVWSSAVQMRPVLFTDTQTQQALTRYGHFDCGDNVVLVEVFYRYKPIFQVLPVEQFITERTLVSRAFLRPRTGDIEAVAGDVSFNAPTATYLSSKRRGFCNS